MDDIEKKKLINQLHHIWNSGDVETIPEVYSTNIVVHWPKGFAVNKSQGLRDQLLWQGKAIYGRYFRHSSFVKGNETDS